MHPIGQKTPGIYYALFQYFWLLVLLPKAVQLVALAAIAAYMLIRNGREKPLDAFTVLQIIFLLIYGCAIGINAFRGGHEFSRIFAAVNTWSITAVALVFYHLYRNVSIDLRRIGKYSLINLLILVGLWLVYRIAGMGMNPSILGRTLYGDDWVDGIYSTRFLGFMDYANLVVFVVLLFYPMALYFLKGKPILSGALTLVLFPVISATNSRSGILLYLIVLAAYGLFWLQKAFFYFYRRNKTLLFVILMAGALGGCILFWDKIAGVVQSFLSMREGSNGMRTLIYSTSIQTMLKTSPVIGVGIKDMLGDYPLGSHSTYIGVFYKAGILGGLIYLCSIIYMAIKIIFGKDTNRHAVTAKICLAAVLLLMVLEDVDGANWCLCVFYILLALLQTKETQLCRSEGTEGSKNE